MHSVRICRKISIHFIVVNPHNKYDPEVLEMKQLLHLFILYNTDVCARDHEIQRTWRQRPDPENVDIYGSIAKYVWHQKSRTRYSDLQNLRRDPFSFPSFRTFNFSG